MSLTTKILLDTRRQKGDQTYPLVIRLTYNRKTVNIQTGYSVTEKDWDAKNQRIKSSSSVTTNITRLNNQLLQKKTKIFDTVTKLEDESRIQSMTISEIKNIILDKQEQKQSVQSFFDELITDFKQAGKNGNARVYRMVLNRINAFTKVKSIEFEQINYRWLKKFETWHFSNGSQLGSLSVYFRTLRAAYNKAIKSNVVHKKYYPFEGYSIKNQETQRKSLSEQDFEKLRNIELEEGSTLWHTRQLFLASFYMRGMNWMDMSFLKRENIQGNFERISYRRQKTGKLFNIKVGKALKEILIYYLEEDDKKEDFVFPILKNSRNTVKYINTITNKRQRFNKRLKEIAKVLEIEPFTIYAARHTYATMAKRKGVPTNIIQESMGHKTEEITQTYLDSFESTVIDEYDELIMS